MSPSTRLARQPDFDAIGRSCYCLQSRMAARSLTRYYNYALAPAGLEVTEFCLLAAVSLQRDQSITRLADRLALERTTLVRSLKRLKDRGLLRLSSTGGREVSYSLTPAGEDVLARAVPHWTGAQQDVETTLGNNAKRVSGSLRDLLRAVAVPGTRQT
jgi:DNA-binding MarR family transcriptional regulator